MNESHLLSLLSDTPISLLKWFDTIGSTNDAALEWLASGAPDFALVAADQQTAGRGRMQRRWITNPGSALAFSVIIHLTQDEEAHSGLIPLMAGAAVCQALEHRYALHPRIKWPNDIMLDGRKTCGILVESQWIGSLASAVIGIGVNITPEAVPEVEAGALPATCVEEAAALPVDRFALLGSILKSLGAWRAAEKWDELILYVQSRMAYLGDPVDLMEPNASPRAGILAGLDASGAAVVDLLTGRELIRAGDVRLRPSSR
jgi:BirA family biotin operon repressor/biotin-[acetyl-CoA-carboxylase] ligase